MGMYTGLRFKVTTKTEYREYIKQVLEYHDWFSYDKLPIIDKWCEFYRYDFIPWSELCYMPDEWDNEYEKYGHNSYNKETGEWRVICSLKNYNSEIQWFLDNLLTKLIESYEYIQHQYELDDYPTNHQIKIEEIVK